MRCSSYTCGDGGDVPETCSVVPVVLLLKWPLLFWEVVFFVSRNYRNYRNYTARLV